MTDQLTQFELLLEAGKLEEAQAMLKMLAASEFKGKQGEAKALLTRLYIRLSNAINQAYLETLKEAIATLKGLDSREKLLAESMKLADARAELAK